MYKYDMDSTSIVKDTEVILFGLPADGRTDGQTDEQSETNTPPPPPPLRWREGIKKYDFIWIAKYR